MPRKPPNPDWGKVDPKVRPAGPTAFDQVVAKLGLAPGEYARSQVLREWVRVNRFKRYVPEALLQSWGMEVSERELRQGFHDS